METSRLDRYNKDECEAYEEIARYKWADDFTCRKCGNVKYFEGKTPFSRRCSKCKTDESATAGTVFDKLRMPLPVALYILREIIKSDTWLKSTLLTKALEDSWHVKLRQQTIWDFLHRLYSAIKIGEIVYDKEALYVTFFTGKKRILLSKGISNGKEYYLAQFNKKRGIDLVGAVDTKTKVETKVVVFDLSTTNWRYKKIDNLRSYQTKIRNRPTLVSDERTEKDLYRCAVEIAKDALPWIAGNHLILYNFKRNSNDYRDLMKMLTKDFVKTKTSKLE